MKIIHITDFHFNKKHTVEQEILVTKLCNEINKIEEVSFIFFTGDLVDKGGDKGKNFSLASQILFDEILAKTNIKKEQIFICCGNHDVNRNKEMPALKAFVDNISNVEDLNMFLVRDKRQFEGSLENIKNYINYQNNFYNGTHDLVDKLYSVHIRNIGEKKVGIATINTAWRSVESSEDKGNLLFPSVHIDQIIKAISECDIKIILMHHPLSDLKDYVFFDIESKIYNNFHFLFSGHVHLDKVETHITGDEGIFCCISPSTLTYGYSESKIGFTLITVDDESDFDALVTRYNYEKRSTTFFVSNPINVQVPLNDEKRKQITLKLTVRRKLKEEVENANELFLSTYDSGKNQKSFLELFTTPALRTKSIAEITSTTDTASLFNIQELSSTSDNYVIFGKNKSGKTSILYKVFLDLLKNYSQEKTLPLYLDCREYKSSKKKWDLATHISRFYSITKNKAIEMASQRPFKLLVDNYDSEAADFSQIITEAVDSRYVSVVLCTEDTLVSSHKQNLLFNFPYKALFIHDISKARVRDLVKKWPNINKESQQVILEKIVKIFSQMNIPCNYWTVSLFLWVFEKTNNITFHNNVELIQLYIDELLDKASLALDKSVKIKYEELKEFLGEFSYYLLNNHASSVYSASYSEMITFTENYRQRNIRFVIEVKDIVDLILGRGIIKKAYNERYTFRLNGVFEYFLAVYINKNSSYREMILEDSNRYLAFGNELELYAGFNNKDKEFIEKIFNKTRLIFLAYNEHYGEASEVDNLLQTKIYHNLEIFKEFKTLSNDYSDALSKLTLEEQEDFMDEMNPVDFKTEEVQLKVDINDIETNSAIHEKSLKLLARVFRNSSVDDVDFNEKILDSILLYTCHFGLSYLDSMALGSSSELTSDVEENDKFKSLLELNARFMPLIVQTFLFDALAQDNLERMLVQKIEKTKSAKGSQFQLMLLYFLLIDLNPVKSTNYMRDLINNITIGSLRQSILVKLYTYVLFYSYGKPAFEKRIKDLIRDLLSNINSSEVEKKLQDLSRQSLIEAMKNKN